MSTWSRSNYRASASASDATDSRQFPTAQPTAEGWQTVGRRQWGNSEQQQQQPQQRRWDNSDTPNAFSKKRDGDRPPRRITEEEARRDYVMKLAAEKSIKDAEQAKQMADTVENFPSLASSKRVAAAAAAAPLPKKSWASQIKTANNEFEQQRIAQEQADKDEAEKIAEGMTILQLNRREMKAPFFTTGQIETEVDFIRNEAIRRSAFSRFSTGIIEEQEKYDYNNESNYGNENDLDENRHVYEPHSPTYPPNFNDECEAEDDDQNHH